MQRPDGTSNAAKLERGQTKAAIQMRRGKFTKQVQKNQSEREREIVTYLR